jgi:hypothetical protein
MAETRQFERDTPHFCSERARASTCLDLLVGVRPSPQLFTHNSVTVAPRRSRAAAPSKFVMDEDIEEEDQFDEEDNAGASSDGG